MVRAGSGHSILAILTRTAARRFVTSQRRLSTLTVLTVLTAYGWPVVSAPHNCSGPVLASAPRWSGSSPYVFYKLRGAGVAQTASIEECANH
jgi:hypothetical protein